MAPPNGHGKDKAEKAAKVLVYAKGLCARLGNRESHSIDGAELRNHILRSFSLPNPSWRALSAEFDELGTSIWNGTTEALRRPHGTEPLTVHALLRVFAFLLLDSAHRGRPSSKQATQEEESIRVLRISLKAGRTCIEHGELDLCTEVFQRAADYVSGSMVGDRKLSESARAEPVNKVNRQLVAEFFLLRATLAWKQEKLSLVSQFLAKSEIPEQTTDDDNLILAEKRADLAYEIGRGSLQKKDLAIAVQFLQMSCNILEQCQSDDLGPDLTELRNSAMLDLVRALTAQKSSDSITRATDLLTFMDGDNGNKLAKALLRLNLLSSQDVLPVKTFQAVLDDIIRTAIFSDELFRSVMCHIQKLYSQDVDAACCTLDFMLERLSGSEKPSWCEKVIVTRVYMSSQDAISIQRPQQLNEFLDHTLQITQRPLSADGTHAAQSLIWKCVENANQAKTAAMAESWCRLARHPLFDRAGELNKAKIARKMMLSALVRGDLQAAREAHAQMPEVGRTDKMSNYLIYKLALRSSDDELASTALHAIAKIADGSSYLFACVQEAQNYGSRLQAIACLQLILEKSNYGPLPGVQLLTLLRTTAQLVIREIREQDTPPESMLLEICKIFEAVATHSKHSQPSPNDDTSQANTRVELMWFSKHSYNLALSYCSMVHPSIIVRLLRVCITFINSARRTDAGPESINLDRREALCNFLAICALVVLARSEDRIELSLQRYLEVRQHVEAFEKLTEKRSQFVNKGKDSSGLLTKRAEVLKYDLEAIVKLEKWEDLDGTLDKCLDLQDDSHLETLADLVLVIHEHVVNANVVHHCRNKLPSVMQTIINRSWRIDHNIKRAARWIRCVFRMTISTNPDMSLQCIDQAVGLASQGQGGPKEQQYPCTELEWLATTSFNRSIDLYCASDMKGFRVWGEKAMNLARTALGSTGLYEQLQRSWMKLTMGSQDG